MANDTATRALTTKPISPGTIVDPSTNERVRVTVTADAGDFDLTFGAQTASNIPFDATAAELEAELEALSSVGEDNVDVTGGPGDATGSAPYYIEFVGDLAGTNVGAVTGSGTDLDLGAGTGTLAIVVITTGSAGQIVAQHLTTVVTDPTSPDAVQVPDAADYPSANATELDTFAVHGEQAPSDVFSDN